MPSTLGKLIRKTRQAKGLGLREFARKIGKSPAFIVSLELEATPPAASEETLTSIATTLELDPDEVLTLAGRTPVDVTPRTALEAYLYRLIRLMPEPTQERLREALEKGEFDDTGNGH
jgi:transcriptional regulator with XRE-family HTH domain